MLEVVAVVDAVFHVVVDDFGGVAVELHLAAFFFFGALGVGVFCFGAEFVWAGVVVGCCG